MKPRDSGKDIAWYSQLEQSYSRPRGQVTSWPSGIYETIYVDPPWPFGDRVSSHTRGAAAHYSCLSVKQIVDLDVEALASNNSLLWMWVPRLFRRWGEEVIESWGFCPKTEWVWVKTTIDGARVRAGMGRYNRMAHEYLMLGTRGAAKPLNGAREPSVIHATRQAHSKKPEVFYELIERNSLLPRIELFARNKRAGWNAWGNEVYCEGEQIITPRQEPVDPFDRLRAKMEEIRGPRGERNEG